MKKNLDGEIPEKLFLALKNNESKVYKGKKASNLTYDFSSFRQGVFYYQVSLDHYR